MAINDTTVLQTEAGQQLVSALVAIDNGEVMINFLRDVMTEKEIIEIGARFEAARMLQNDDKYVDIVSKTKLSSRTVARISDWMKNGCGGYRVAIQLIHNGHIPPVSAE